ncbi:MAG: MATE family efflux transporter [Gammaproteobacteria bacterium]|nr:MATE family efflux transporter [Gammaproteobacteria bacterium]
MSNEETVLIPMPLSAVVLSRKAAMWRVLCLAIPMALSYTFSLEMWLLVLFLSRLNSDKEHSAAITLITTMINALVIIGISPLFAMSAIAGREIGALKKAQERNEPELDLQRRKDKIARVNHHGLMIATTMIPFAAVPLIFSEAIFRDVFRQNAEVAKLAQRMTRPYAIAIPGVMLRLCSEQMMFSFGKTKPAMVMGLVNASIGMGLTYFLAFGKPQLGEEGILIGYITEAYLTAAAFSLYIACHPDFKDYAFFRPQALKTHLKDIRELLNIGRSICIGNAIEMGAILGTGAVAGRVGVMDQAAYSTTMQFILFTLLLQSACGQSISQEVSRRIGEQDYQNAVRIGRYGVVATLGSVIGLPLLFSVKPAYLGRLLGQNTPEMQAILTYLVPMMAFSVLWDAPRYDFLQTLRNNLGDGQRATLVSSVGLLSGVLLSWALGTQTRLGIYGVALGYLIGLMGATLGLFVRWNARLKPDLIEINQVAVEQITTEVAEPDLVVNERDRFFLPYSSTHQNGLNISYDPH